MKILSCCEYDWANFQFYNAEALRRVGIDCVDLKLMAHHYNYPDQSKIVDEFEFLREAEQADVIQIFHTDTYVYNLLKHLNKRFFVYHTGSKYRAEPEPMNEVFKKVEITFIDSPEFYELGGTNVIYIATGIDTDKLKYTSPDNSIPLFAHYPSGEAIKGTSKIVQMLSEVDPTINFKFDINRKNWEENGKRISECDIYIELFSPTQQINGQIKKYGSFGVTAFEAAALGKIVVTNSTHHEVYIKHYGDCELMIANNEKDFKNVIKQIQEMSWAQIEQKKKATRKWIEEKHSLKSTGNYLKKFYEN